MKPQKISPRPYATCQLHSSCWQLTCTVKDWFDLKDVIRDALVDAKHSPIALRHSSSYQLNVHLVLCASLLNFSTPKGREAVRELSSWLAVQQVEHRLDGFLSDRGPGGEEVAPHHRLTIELNGI